MKGIYVYIPDYSRYLNSGVEAYCQHYAKNATTTVRTLPVSTSYTIVPEKEVERD